MTVIRITACVALPQIDLHASSINCKKAFFTSSLVSRLSPQSGSQSLVTNFWAAWSNVVAPIRLHFPKLIGVHVNSAHVHDYIISVLPNDYSRSGLIKLVVSIRSLEYHYS